MTPQPTIFQEIIIRIGDRLKDLSDLISKSEQTIAKLQNENNLIEDLDTRVANKNAIDLYVDIVKTQRINSEITQDLCRECINLHKAAEKKYNELSADVQPFIKTKKTANNIRDFFKWLGGLSVIGILSAILVWIVKNVKVIS